MVDFNTLIEGPTIQYDDDNVAGWYVNNQRVYNKPNGFTDSPTVTTGYTLRFNTSGVFYEYSCTVTVFAPPDLVIPNDVTICSGESVQLSASVTNATPLTEILWTYGGFNYDNGYWLSPRATGAHTVTVTAANTPLCPTVSKDLHITVNFKATLAKGDPSTVTYCIQETINLNDCIDFFVYDTHANNEKHKADDTTGTITWLNASDYSVISDPEHVLLTSLNDTAFFADVSGIMVFYSNACTPAFQQSPNIPLVRVPINITANYFSLTYGYDNMCRGDSVYAAFRLLDDQSNPSPCDTIRDLDVLSGHNVVRQIRTSPTEKTLVFAPFTDLYDTIKVKAKGNLVGVEKDFELFLRKPEPPIIQSDHVCKNTDAYFTVIADHCDTIYHIECPTINDVPHISGQREWTMYVPELSNTTPFQCQVTYFSKLQDDTVKNFLVNHTLEVWIDPPELSVSLMHNHSTLPFNHTAQNLCLGDSLLFTFFTPHNCDTITSITWLQNSGTLNYQDPHVRSFTIKPVQEGDNTYRARVYYKRPKEAIILSIEITYTVKVKRRPRLFISPNPPDTLKYCYPDDAPLNLNLPNPSAAIIDYNFVASGPDTVRFLVPNGSHVDTLSSFKPPVTGNYVVEANYKYLCSEMDTTLARGEVRIVVNSKTEDGATFIVTPPSEGFCISEGITIRSANKEGSSLAWEHNGIAVTSFPYFPPGGTGTHTFTTYIYNACYPSGSPKRYDIDVRVAPIPAVEAMPDITVCRGDSVTLKVAPGSFVGDTLIWWTLSGTTTKDTVEVYATTTFKATARNVCGDISDEVTVFCMADAAVHLMPDTAACLHDEIRLRVIQKEGDIIWRSSHFNLIGTGDNFTIRVDGNETYTAVAFNQCGRDSAYLRVTALYLPSVTVKNDTSICHGAFLDFSDCIIGNALGILQWRPGQGAILTEPGRYITDPDIYIATVSTEKCGSDSDTTYVNVYPPLLLLPDNSNLPRYNNQDLYDVSFQTLQAAPALSYSISGTLPAGLIIINGRISGKPVLGPYDYNTHHLQVSVTDGHQCQTSREYILAPEWKAATVLLPVGDAENAVFLPGYNLEVYNRNGLLLHKGMGWDGMWNNTFVPPGTYFYSVKILIDDRLEDRMGYVVVMYY